MRKCPNCEGSGFKHWFGGWRRECRKCGGTGEITKLSTRLWQRLRYGAESGD